MSAVHSGYEGQLALSIVTYTMHIITIHKALSIFHCFIIWHELLSHFSHLVNVEGWRTLKGAVIFVTSWSTSATICCYNTNKCFIKKLKKIFFHYDLIIS